MKYNNYMNRLFLVLVGLLLPVLPLFSQETFPLNDVKDQRAEAYAFTNATIIQNSHTILKKASMLIRRGKIIAVGKNIKIPNGVSVFNLKGKFIYPSFIDLHTNYGLPKPKKGKPFDYSKAEQVFSKNKNPVNANEAIKSEYNTYEHFEIDKKEAKKLRNLGFGAVVTFMPDGLARGTSALVSLNDEKVNMVIIKNVVAAQYSFKKGSSTQMFPVSIMGSIALLKQTHYDAQWYHHQQKEQFFDASLEAYNRNEMLPHIFSVTNLLDLFRASNLGNTLGKKYIIKGSGHEYQQINHVKALNAPLIIPINFPTPPNVNDPYEALDVSLAKMKHWELAPGNLAVLANTDIDFAISTTNLLDKAAFWKNLRKAIKQGLSEEAALKALTETPAAMIKAEKSLGQLKPGLLANFLICTNNIFSDSMKIHENWTLGQRYVVSPIEQDYSGTYRLALADTTYQLEISGNSGTHKYRIVKNDTSDIKVSAAIKAKFITLSFSPNTDKQIIRLSGWIVKKDMKGTGQLADGSWITWTANYSGEVKKKEDKEKEEDQPGPVIFPFVAYGDTALPEQEDILIKNTTVWSNESSGILTNTDVLIRHGKIFKIGTNLSRSSARVIDGTGKHLTAGIIDEHTHIALSNVNDVAANSSMVQMEDAINPTDINIYRQLAGGVTAAQLLHGSANPIDGQSAIIKLRWGHTADEMLIDGADKFIKFALGENVKKSWSNVSTRYPQTRMGVEQIYMDAFSRAHEYGEKWMAYNALSTEDQKKTFPPRRELDLEPLLEIINGQRFISCHSYVQSEINMLMKVADKFGFTINTFTHILEGYKVADKMKAHGAGASTFSDWYNYKYEVIDAIPYNAVILRSQGIITAINSDDAEMGRRLNQEAAKSIKYGGMKEEEALKMVTLNPAKLLHLDEQMGSIKVGKDADIVLWSEHPLSIYAVAEKTIIDGTVYYDIEQNKQKQQWIIDERARLTQKIKNSKEKPSGKPSPPTNHYWHCDDLFIDNQ